MRARLRTGLFIVLAFLWILTQSAQDAWGKGPKGAGGGRGGGKPHASFRGGKHGGGYADTSAKSPWSTQRTNEERKLNHRLGVADKLDQIAERNGNANLYDAAERKREKARQLYDKRLAKIDGKDPDLEPGDELPSLPEPPAGPSDGPPGTGDSDAPGLDADPPATSQKLTGRENALSRQLRNEQRKLARQMEMAERLWDAYEQTGDEQLADAARAVEERALAQYEKRMSAIGDFQQRHGLPDIIGDGPAPDSPVPVWRREEPRIFDETITPLLRLLR